MSFTRISTPVNTKTSHDRTKTKKQKVLSLKHLTMKMRNSDIDMTRRFDVILASFSRKYIKYIKQFINKLSNISIKAII